MLDQVCELKKIAAISAIDYIEPDSIIGVGTGSTIKYFIEELAMVSSKIRAAIPSSTVSANALKNINIPLADLNDVGELSIYVDGADQINHLGQMIKGGGGALTKEKIIASVAKTFICIVDETKNTKAFGTFPIPIEVIKIARSYVARECIKLGGTPKLRENYTTDNGNVILDVAFGIINEPISLEYKLNNINGIVSNGIFGARGADIALIGTNQGVKKYAY